MLKQFIRALRLPFTSACLLPFLFAFVRSSKNIDPVLLILGAITVTATHLSANLINDAADSKTGVDNLDENYYGFFGGSKLIQEGKLSVSWYYKAAVISAICSAACLLTISILINRWETPFLYLLVLAFAWQYSCKPLALAYRGLGEITVFILFGPICIAGGSFFAGTGYPDIELLIISTIFGFLTSGILVANEIPDAETDAKGGKNTLVVKTGAEKGWILFVILELMAWATILYCAHQNYISKTAAGFAFLGFPLTFFAAFILKKYYDKKDKLTISSKLAISVQLLVGLALLLEEIYLIYNRH
ncbi:MAG: prenyltransferase [Candidatus Rifleibacteriota bacterium]